MKTDSECKTGERISAAGVVDCPAASMASILDPALSVEPMTAAQEQAVGSEKKTVIVTASAGAGKTSTMIKRVLDFVARKGVPLSAIVMLTFTNKAAEEMKTRLSEILHDAIVAATDPNKKARLIRTDDPAEKERLARETDPIRCKRIAEAIDELPLFHCSTIDAFCFKLVKSHFQLLGLSPMVRLAEEDEQSWEKSQAIRELLDECYRTDPDGYHALLDSFGDEDKVGAAIKKVYDYAVTTEDPDGFLDRAEKVTRAPVEESPAMVRFFENVREGARKALERIRLIPPPSRAGKMRNAREKMERGLELYKMASSLEDIAAAKAFVGKVNTGYTDESEEDQLRFGDVREVYKTYTDGIASCTFTEKALRDHREVTELARKETLRLIESARAFKRIYSRIKEEKGFIDFSDVEHYALTLFVEHGLSSELGCKFLLVDESQDLNPLQDKLMQSIVGGNDLFMVGDVKQSIYRFRLSDPHILQDRIEFGKSDRDAAVIEFTSNFRSCDVIVEFVNRVFGRLMSEEFGGVEYPTADRGGHREGSGDVRLFFYPREKQEGNSAAGVYSVEAAARAKAEEAERECPEGVWVRDRIRELKGTKYRSTNPSKTEPLEIDYSDIAILSAKKMAPNNLQERVVDTLRRAGIPVNIGGFVKGRDYSEITAIVDFLRLLESPANDYAMLSVLRSDMFGYSVDRIAEISLLDGASFSEKAWKAREEDAALKGFFDYLERMRALSGVLSLYELVARLVDEKMRLPVLGRSDGRKVFGEITSFVEGLKGMDPMPSISEYIPFFDKYYSAGEGGEIADANAVNVMTIHASKGLGFPVVFVIGLNDAVVGKADAGERVFADKEFTLVEKPSTDGDKSIYVEQFKRKKEKELKEDKLRLLYVALTRARNYLFLSGALPEDGKGKREDAQTMTEWLLYAIEGSTFGFVSDNPPYHPAAQVGSERKDESAESVLSPRTLRQAWDEKYDHEKAAETSIKYTVTAINEREEVESATAPPKVSFPEEDRKAKGTAFHVVMEEAPFTLADERETDAFLDKLVRDGSIEAADRAELSARTVFGAVRGVAALVNGWHDYREKSFLLRLPARDAGVSDTDDCVLVQGKIDLLAIRGNEAILVDYKRSGLSSRVLAAKYAKQLDLYARAVKAGYPNITSVKKYIFVLGRNEAILLDS